MNRDFTNRSFESFCSVIRQVQSEQWLGITDWIGDRYLDVKHWLGDLGLYDKMADLDKYHKEVLDKENTSIAQLREIFENVSSVDTRYTGSTGLDFGFVNDVLHQYSQYAMKLASVAVSVHNSIQNGGKLEDCFRPDIIAQIMSSVSTDLKTVLNEIQFTADSFGDISDTYKQDYVNRIEAEHPDYKQLMDQALSDPDLTDAERRDIKFLIYNGPEPYRSIYIEHMKDYKIEVRMTYVDSDGKTKTQGSYYSPPERRIYLKDSDETFAKNPRGPYATFFHESGHLIDDFEYGGGGGRSKTLEYKYNGKQLHDLVVEDTRAFINQYIDDEMSELSADQREQILRSLNLTDDAGFSYKGDAGALDKKLSGYRDKIIRYMNHDLAGETNEAASDVYGGVTNNALIGNYGHRPDSNTTPEQFNYWYQSGSATGLQEMELWAEFYSAQMTHDEAALASIRRHFPNAYEAMEKMANEMANTSNGLFGGGGGGGIRF